jgi:ribose-phosphate pyrophosphokinase
MKTININTNEGIKTTIFPDNQPHVNIQDIQEGDEVTVICSIVDSSYLLLLLNTANALENLFARKKVLVIPYLMAARSDRVMLPGDSVDLKVVANLINSCGFEKVYLYDVHSDVATLLINNAISITNKNLVEQYNKENAILICPDAGAAKKVSKYFEWNTNLIEIIYCNKSRDLSTGKITLKVLEPEKCIGRPCVIIDDICDGGGTFLAIAEQIQPAHLTLIVTHGIFSKGYDALAKYFHQIIVSNSLYKKYEAPFIKTVDHFKL